MENKIKIAVNEARKFFNIKDYPGNFFSILEKNDTILENKLFLFKEDIDTLSGFIGYGSENSVVICLNYKRPIGHQNFSLAHEVGHFFLHKGECISDADTEMENFEDNKEKEANKFAKELLYPDFFAKKDHLIAQQKNLFFKDKRKDLGLYVDNLCHQYFLSFEMVLNNLLYNEKLIKQNHIIRKEIEDAVGGKISKVLDNSFYFPNEELPQYQKYMRPFDELLLKINESEKKQLISKATAESIKLRNGLEI